MKINTRLTARDSLWFLFRSILFLNCFKQLKYTELVAPLCYIQVFKSILMSKCNFKTHVVGLPSWWNHAIFNLILCGLLFLEQLAEHDFWTVLLILIVTSQSDAALNGISLCEVSVHCPNCLPFTKEAPVSKRDTCQCFVTHVLTRWCFMQMDAGEKSFGWI